MARPLWAGLQVVVSVSVEFAIERTYTGRERSKKSVGEIKCMVVTKQPISDQVSRLDFPVSVHSTLLAPNVLHRRPT